MCVGQHESHCRRVIERTPLRLPAIEEGEPASSWVVCGIEEGTHAELQLCDVCLLPL
jgi:hypothetical protein